MADDTRDRARGALVGLACGDAVGTTLEFTPPGAVEPLTDMVGGGPFRLRPGQWTDDTSMALCLAESIVDRRGLDLADQLRRYLRWMDDGYLSSTGTCFDIGVTTRAQLERFRRTGEPVDPHPDQEQAANGSLMRLAPVPIAWHRDVDEAAERSAGSSRSTHAARRPVDASRVMGALLARLIAGTPWEEASAPGVLTAAGTGAGDLHPEVAAVDAGSFREKAPPEIVGSGFCIRALEAALWAVDGAAGFEEAVLRAANLGDDADTTAAIAGQLAGARWGHEAIPGRWRARLAMEGRILSLADALFDLHGDGPGAGAGWLHDEPIHAWWVEPGAVLAGEYPAERAGGTTKLDILVDHGVRSFVDLTTDRDRLAPYAPDLEVVATARDLDLRHRRFPIPDLGTIELDGYRRIVAHIRAEVDEGRPCYVHCWGGIGRTGTVVGCLLAAASPAGGNGTDADAVVASIAQLREGTRKIGRRSPETDAQVEVIRAWLDRPVS